MKGQYQQGALMGGAKDEFSIKKDNVHVDRGLKCTGQELDFHTGDRC